MAGCGRGRVIAHPASGSFCSPQVKLTVPCIYSESRAKLFLRLYCINSEFNRRCDAVKDAAAASVVAQGTGTVSGQHTSRSTRRALGTAKTPRLLIKSCKLLYYNWRCLC